MPKYAVAVEGAQYEVDAPDEQTAWNWAVYTHQNQPKAQPPAPFSLADVGLTGAAAVAGAGKSVLQAFGPEAPGVETLGGIQKSLLEMRTPERQAEVARRTAIEQQAAKTGTAAEEIGAFLGGIKEAPIQSIAQGIGSTVPALLTGAVALVAGAPLGIATAVGIGTRFLFGALQGAGEVKGSIYDNVYRELRNQGISDVDAKRQAEAAQDYIGNNTDNIFVGAGLGALAGGTGAEKILGNYVAKKMGVDLAAGAAKKEAEGLIMRGVKEALREGIPEGLQGGQEQFASNVALSREGIETPEFEGVLGSAARDAALGALTGGVVSPFGRQKAAPQAEAPIEKLPEDQLISLRDRYNEAENELQKLADAAKAPDLTPEAKQAAIESFINFKNNIFAPLRLEFSKYRPQIDALTPKTEPTVEPGVEPAPTAKAPEPAAGPLDEAGLRDLNTRFQEAKKQLDLLKNLTRGRDLTPEQRQEAVNAYKDFKVNIFNPLQQEYGKNRQAILALPKVVTLPPTPPAPPAAPPVAPGATPTDPTIDQPSGEPPRNTSTPSPIVDEPKSPEPPATPVEEPAGLPTPPEKREFQIDTPKEQIAKDVQGMTIPQLARWAVINAPNTPARQFALKAFDRINQFADRGIFPGKIQVLNGGIRNESGTRGRVTYRHYRDLKQGFDMSLMLNGIPTNGVADGLTGTQYSTILHELLHAATILEVRFNPKSKPVKELENLYARVKAQVKTDIKNGVQHPALEGIKRGANTMQSVDELIAWGLTDKNFQDYLSGIKVGNKTAFTKFVEIMRKLLNINPEFETALDSLMRSTENLLSTPVSEMEKGMGIKLRGAQLMRGAPAPRVELPKAPTPPKAEEPTPPKPPKAEEPPAAPKEPTAPGQPPVLDETGVTPAKGRHPQVQAAAKLLQQGKLSREEFDKYVNYYTPIQEVEADKLKPPSTMDRMRDALRANDKQFLGVPIADGARVGLRMDVPALKKGVPIVSIHKGRSNNDPKTGKPYKTAAERISYSSTGYIKDVFFAPRDQEKGLIMGMTPAKNPLQTAEGVWVNMDPAKVYERVKQLMNDPAWVQVGFDPARHGYFYNRKNKEPVASADEMFQIGNFLLAKNVKYAPKEQFLYERAAEPITGGTEENVGARAVDIIDKMGLGVQPPAPSAFQKARQDVKTALDNPKLTVESAKKATTGFLDKFETATFSSSSAFDNQLRRAVAADIKENEEVIGMLIDASQSQAVHADALASQFIIEGGLRYDEEYKKWVSYKEPDNFVELGKQINEIAKKYNISEDEARRITHTYFMSKRLRSLQERNENDKARIEELKAERDVAKTKDEKAKINREIERLKDREAFIHLADPEIELGLSLGEMMPELNGVADTWNGIRRNARRVLVNSGLWTDEYADQMLDVIDYVPFYREVQLEEGQGPREFVRGLQVQAKEHQLKGTNKPVNDILDNMVRWTQYAVNRSVRNDKAVRMIDAALKIEMGDGTKMAERVEKAERGMNVVRIWRDGKQELYNMADPLFADAFTGIQSIAIEPLNWFSKVANTLRDSVVLFPLFSFAQVPQDAFAAMFSSGLQPQYALRIPILAVKEFIKTLSKSSETHQVLKRFGAVGVRDFNSSVIRDDAEVFAGIKAPPGVKGKIKEYLQHIAMSADNSIRQAVYEASVQQGLSKAEALEKAFEIINFRRRGTNKMFQLAGQTIPFFYAYLAAQRVAYNTLSGTGISPQDRKAAWKTLMYTSAAVMTLSMLYAMMAADDEDYKKTPAAIRDRTLTIPGTGGLRIPLRTDFFLFPKIVAEHTYLLMTDKGYEDGAKFRKSMINALGEALFSPTLVPQLAKPAVEALINYDFYQARPILGQYEKQKEWSRQFNESTSEVSKLLGKTGAVSPIMADHLFRGFFGTTGGLFLWFTNTAINKSGLTGVAAPEKTLREAIEAFPGTSGFLSRTNESALRTDFYELRDKVNTAAATFNDIKKNNPQGIKDYLEDEKRMARLVVNKQVENVNQKLAELRARIRQITEAPTTMMTGAEKADAIRQLRQIEQQIYESINVKGLREKAQL
jgi:hypothetical protein